MCGVMSIDLKRSRVVPIHKAGDKTLKTNYRPISVLPAFSKIFERLVYNRLFNFLTLHNIIYENQFGFLPKKSTTHALISFVNEIINAFESNKFSCGIFLDLSKAFDTLDHDILLLKMQHYGIRDIAYSWFQNYLTDRCQYVSIANCNSHLRTNNTGVPQGSILGPGFF